MSGYRESAKEDRSVLVVGMAGVVFGYQAHTGVPLWQSRVNDYGQEVELAIEAGRVLAVSGRKLTALDYKSGEILGSVELPGPFGVRPVLCLEGGRAYVALGKTLCCLSMEGELVWQRMLETGRFSSPSLGFPGNIRQADRDE